MSVLAIEELGAVDGSASVLVDVHNTLMCDALMAWANDDVKQRFLPRLAGGELGAYALSRNSHVRADVLYRFWKPRTQASMDLLLYILFFFPAVAAFIYSGWNYAEMSVRFREVSIFSPAGIPVFPLKALTPVTGVMLLLQGLAESIRCVICIRQGAWPPRLHDVEETESIIMQEQKIHAGEQTAPAAPGQEGR